MQGHYTDTCISGYWIFSPDISPPATTTTPIHITAKPVADPQGKETMTEPVRPEVPIKDITVEDPSTQEMEEIQKNYLKK